MHTVSSLDTDVFALEESCYACVSQNKPEAIDLDWSKILLRCSLRMRVQRVRVICAKARHGLVKDE